MRDALRAGWYGFLSLAVAVCALVTAPRVNAERCTNLINYAGDPRSNAVINSIGASTGQCPAPMTGVAASAAPSSQVPAESGPTGGTTSRISLDNAFLQKLQSFPVVAGVWDKNPGRAIQLAKKGCDLSESGYRQNQIVTSLISEYSSYSADVVATTIGVGAMIYCPAALDRP